MYFIMEDYYEVLDDYYKYLKEENEKFKKAFEVYKQNSLVKFSKIEKFWDYDELFDFEGGDYFHIGYCNVEKIDYKNGFRPNAEYFKIKECETDDEHFKDAYSSLHFEKCYHEEKKFHTLVWQTTTCCEDDYSGYILFPMKNGKYWIVSFANIQNIVPMFKIGSDG